jgi:hypothetical protein
LKIRLATIKKLLNGPYSQISAYEQVGQIMNCGQRGPVCRHDDGPACDALIYGSLTLFLAKRGFWPKKAAEDVHGMVRRLANVISGLKIFSLPGYADHMDCGKRNYAEDVAKILSEMPNPILDSHKVHMKIQRGEALESTISR